MTSCFEDGDPESTIVLIGEAPSWEEIRKQTPFVGPAGSLLDRCMHSAQIIRRKVYITNVFETQVKKSVAGDKDKKIYSLDGVVLWDPNKSFTEAGRAASAGCLARLRACSANVLVPLGAVAMDLCLGGPRKITKWRGSIIPGIFGRKVIPTIHPSACLRGVYEWRYYIMSDFKKVLRESTHPEIRPLARKLIIDPGFEESKSFLLRCLDSPKVNTDIELLGGQVDCLSIASDPLEAICIPFLDPGFESRWSDSEELELWRLYARIISSPDITKINQNIGFDLSTLFQLNNIIPRGPVEDCMVAFSIMNPFLSKGLGTIGSMCTDEPYYKDDGELEDAPTVKDFKQRWEYNAKDSTTALASWEFLAPLIDSEGYRATYEMTMGMVGALIHMMVCGVPVDEAALIRERHKVTSEIAIKVKELEAALGRPIITSAPTRVAEKRDIAARNAININAPAQISEYFYKHLKLRPCTNNMGALTTDDKALARIYSRDGRIEAKLLQEYRGLAKLLSTYLEVLYDNDKRLRCSYNIRGTWAGRLSSAETVFGTGLNFQNLPPDFRSFLVSDDLFESLAQ